MQKIQFYQAAFNDYLRDYELPAAPKNLYEPIAYILNLGGKRLRPVLTLVATDIFGGDHKKALDAALSIEVFHNFSLVHDDIMDDAHLRRGQTTVHQNWDVNTGILSGDAMLIMAYQLFENYDAPKFKSLAELFSKTALQVCEGQQYDIDFETRNDVTLDEYIKMIEYKTAVLVGAAMQMGALIADASTHDLSRIYDFGKNLGIAFQLQDDYLDTFGDASTFGKKIGGDIAENKKTVLYLKTLESASESDKASLTSLFSDSSVSSQHKIEVVTGLFRKYKADEQTKAEIKRYTDRAYSVLEVISIASDKKTVLRDFGEALMNREV